MELVFENSNYVAEGLEFQQMNYDFEALVLDDVDFEDYNDFESLEFIQTRGRRGGGMRSRRSAPSRSKRKAKPSASRQAKNRRARRARARRREAAKRNAGGN